MVLVGKLVCAMGSAGRASEDIFRTRVVKVTTVSLEAHH